MVIKLAEEEGMEEGGSDKQEKRKKKGRTSGIKRSHEETEKGDAVQDPETEAVEAEDVQKKLKVTVDDDVLNLLASCENLVNVEKAGFDANAVVEALTELFSLILQKNVNSVLIKVDFSAWVKEALVKIIQHSSKAKVSEGLIRFLMLTLKVTPIVFESLLERVLEVVLFRPKAGPEVQDDCDQFMKQLSLTFEKLRRFPKFIAKFLCCVRDHLTPEVKASGIVLSPVFIHTLGPVINMLTVGQVVDLWKMFQHNLDKECIQHFVDGSSTRKTKAFFSIAVDLFVEFLSNIKVIDYTVPAPTVEKVYELMSQLSNESLLRLGSHLSNQNRIDREVAVPFLKLCLEYGDLRATLLNYNSKYKVSDNNLKLTPDISSPLDLSKMHSYLTEEVWVDLTTSLMKREDREINDYIVSLVAQQLKFLITSVSQDRTLDTDPSWEKYFQSASEFILIHQKDKVTKWTGEVIVLVTQFVSFERIIELAKCFVDQFPSKNRMLEGNDAVTGSAFNESATFHHAVILESLTEVMRRIQKMKILSTPIKNLLKDELSETYRIALLQHICLKNKQGPPTTSVTEIMKALLDFINNLLKSSNDGSLKATRHDFSSELLSQILHSLSEIDFENYSKDMKTIVFLCSVVIFVALLEESSPSNVIDLISKIMASSGASQQGNETLFALEWKQFFQLYTSQSSKFSDEVNERIGHVILENVCVSQKWMTEFFDSLFEDMNLPSNSDLSLIHVVLTCVEFLLKEMQLQGTKAKLISQLQDHCRKLTAFIVQKLDEWDTDEPNFYRACWLSHRAIEVMDDHTSQAYKSSLGGLIKKCIKYLKTKHSGTQDKAGHALRFLHVVAKSREKFIDTIPPDFLAKMWKSILHSDMLQIHQRQGQLNCKSLVPKNFVKDLLVASNPSELESFCNLIVERGKDLANDPENYEEASMLIHVLSELLEAELTPEKKSFRRHTLQECITAFLMLTLIWDTADSVCLNQLVIPYLQFQTKILRRRGAMMNLKTLAVCLTSPSSVNLGGIDDIHTFKTVFCTLGELMNALALHRLDVIGFRLHVFLQGFQYLLESLTKRSDQKHHLNDEDIGELRTCGQSVERLCQSMRSGKKEFSRSSPYFVATLVKQFESCTVYPAVKTPLLSACYKLLDLCDDHGVAQLNSLLSLGSKEIFKNIYDQYKKYYQYKGRV